SEWHKPCACYSSLRKIPIQPWRLAETLNGGLPARHIACTSAAIWCVQICRRFYEVVSCAPFVVQSEVSHEARSNRCRKRKHFGCDRWGGSGECKVLSALRPCSNLSLASLYPPKPARLGSPRGRSVHYSVFRPKQSGSHRRWEPWLQSSRPPPGKKHGPP